ncbi:MAG: ferredoxin [Bacilli bacterium]|nr:ferredoxin [Bacilli bacterium]
MKKIVVDKIKCIGCGACVGNDDEHFDFDDSGLSEVKTQENIESEALAQAIDGCPTGAISIEEEQEN